MSLANDVSEVEKPLLLALMCPTPNPPSPICCRSLYAPTCAPTRSSADERVGAQVGAYRLLQQIGEGGFGVGHISASSSGFSTSDTSFAKDIGGGLDYKLIKGVAWRVQGDGLFTHVFGVSQDNFRFSTGIVLRF